MNLNLGCGTNLKPGYVNVDKFGNPDVRWDLEEFPWPFETDSADLVELVHVLEHLGQTPALFIRILQELYRVMKPNGVIVIKVPHFRHDCYANDPTHVRIVTPEGLAMFDQALNRQCEINGWSNTQLGRYHGIDFSVVQRDYVSGSLGEQFKRAAPSADPSYFVNVFEEIQIVLKAMKPPRFPL